jgi:methyl-accepting chemotaxis protein
MQVENVVNEIAIQAELLALNAALEGEGAESASEALYKLAQELRQAGPLVRVAKPGARTGLRLES